MEELHIIETKPEKVCNTFRCDEMLREIYDGNYLLLPNFVHSLISFLYEDIPDSDDPRVLGSHIASRGMYVLQRAHELGNEQKEVEQTKNLTSIITRDIAFFCLGFCTRSRFYLSSFCIFFTIKKMCDEYTFKYDKIIDYCIIVLLSYIWYTQ